MGDLCLKVHQGVGEGSLTTIRGILVSGITGHLRGVARSKERGTSLHRSTNQSAGSRRTKKLLARTQWFRGNEQETEGEERSTTTATSRERVARNEVDNQMGKQGGKAKHCAVHVQQREEACRRARGK